ncbi:unnamed protein product [Prorocentrum cordatum]|uniref:SWIM-type domain-containing protein n=1 Tax=Prorocentrum cordatum TaxID=2364126 RepID=A0ABN9XWE1_9DINO|nr:unnamed protein product [Polarella glacialis]
MMCAVDAERSGAWSTEAKNVCVSTISQGVDVDTLAARGGAPQCGCTAYDLGHKPCPHSPRGGILALRAVQAGRWQEVPAPPQLRMAARTEAGGRRQPSGPESKGTGAHRGRP